MIFFKIVENISLQNYYMMSLSSLDSIWCDFGSLVDELRRISDLLFTILFDYWLNLFTPDNWFINTSLKLERLCKFLMGIICFINHESSTSGSFFVCYSRISASIKSTKPTPFIVRANLYYLKIFMLQSKLLIFSYIWLYIFFLVGIGSLISMTLQHP